MINLFDYIAWRGDITFDQVPVNKIDALIFANLMYVKIHGLVSEKFSEQKTISQLSADFLNSPDYKTRKNSGLFLNKKLPDLLAKAGESQRFGSVLVSGLKIKIDEELEEQFAAMTFDLGKEIVVAFEGTDDTIVGWKEDFNLAYLDQIPAQKDALEYFDDVADSFSGSIIVTGHSKGGNLAVNTSVNCNREHQNRIKTVYNFDGPGFKDEFFETDCYKAIADRIFSFYPVGSVVGMIFKHKGVFEIIKSEGIGLKQHDALMWQLFGANYVNEEDFSSDSKLFNKSFNEWADNLSVEERKILVRTIFGVLEYSGAKTNTQLSKNVLHSSKKMLEAYSAIPKERKEAVSKIFKSLAKVVADSSSLAKVFDFFEK